MIELHQGDCLKILPEIKTGSIDFVLTDTPFGATQNKWDSVIPLNKHAIINNKTFPSKNNFLIHCFNNRISKEEAEIIWKTHSKNGMWEELKRVIKTNGAIILFGSQPFTSALIRSNTEMFKYELIWAKNKASGHLNAKKMPLRNHENILVFYKRPPVYNPQMTTGHKPGNYAKTNANSENYGSQVRVEYGGSTKRYPKSIQEFNVVNNDSSSGQGRLHPTQKPLGILEWLIKTYSNEDETVLDFTMGSGSTGVAAKRLNRSFIGIELDSDYFKISYDRIHYSVHQISF